METEKNNPKEIANSLTDAIVVKLLSEKKMYGYEIIKLVNGRTDGAFKWKEGTLYPRLHKLEERGLIRSEWELNSPKPRKYYSLTKKGLKAAAPAVEEAKAFLCSANMLLSV